MRRSAISAVLRAATGVVEPSLSAQIGGRRAVGLVVGCGLPVGGVVEADADDGSEVFHVAVMSEQGGLVAVGDRSDHAVDHPGGRDPGLAATAVDACCAVAL